MSLDKATLEQVLMELKDLKETVKTKASNKPLISLGLAWLAGVASVFLFSLVF